MHVQAGLAREVREHDAGRGQDEGLDVAEPHREFPQCEKRGKQDGDIQRPALAGIPERIHAAALRMIPKASKIERSWRMYAANSGVSRIASVRGRGRSISTIPATRPGFLSMTITRSDRNTASEMLCVTRATVLRVRSQM